MQSQSKRTNRTIVVDFQDEATYYHLRQDGRAFIEFVIAFIISNGPKALYDERLSSKVFLLNSS